MENWINVTTQSSLDEISSVLTRPNGEIYIGSEQCKVIAVVQFVDASIAILATNLAEDSWVEYAVWATNNTKMHQKQLKVSRFYKVQQSTLNALYEGKLSQTVISAIGRDATDEFIDHLLRRAIAEESNDLHFLGGPATTEIKIHRHGKFVKLDEIASAEYRLLAKAIYLRCREKSKEDDWNIDQPMRGQFSREIDGKRYAIRLQTQNAHPDIVDMSLRILLLGEQVQDREFIELGFTQEQDRALRAMLDQPTGMVILSGPTGSGKSTTLAAMLSYLNRRFEGEAKIQTLEDPVEYEIPGVRQSNVTKALPGETEEELWDRAITTLMRMKPNIIMLGEIRNSRSAKAAQQAARTGHKLLTTIHADRCISFYARMMDEFQLRVAALAEDGFVNGIVRQHLLPVLCQDCSILLANALEGITSVMRQALIVAGGENTLDQIRVLNKQSDCNSCSGRGYIGQTVVAEIMLPDEAINNLIEKGDFRAAENLWKDRKAGHLAEAHAPMMLEHALIKVFSGLISPVDVDRYIARLHPDSIPVLNQNSHSSNKSSSRLYATA